MTNDPLSIIDMSQKSGPAQAKAVNVVQFTSDT
jgi:hypothetical protein